MSALRPDDSQSIKTFLIIYLKVRYDEQIAITIVNYLVASKNVKRKRTLYFYALRSSDKAW